MNKDVHFGRACGCFLYAPSIFRTDRDVREIEQQRVCPANSTLNSVHGSTLFNRLFSKALERQKRQGGIYMVEHKAWDWEKIETDIWYRPAEIAYYLAERWKQKGYSHFLSQKPSKVI